MRSAFTTGFKAPQTYDEDLHLCGVAGDQRITRNANDLKEERSYSFSAGVGYQGFAGNTALMVSVSGFHTRLNNVFTEKFIGKSGGIEVWQRINGEGASVQGVEIDLDLRPVPQFEVRGGLTVQQSRFSQPLADFDTRHFLRTPEGINRDPGYVYGPSRPRTFYAGLEVGF